MSEIIASIDRWLPFALGAVLVLVGRRLFWLLVATLGFLVAFTLAQRLAPDSPEPLHWVLAVGAGLIGALLAIFAQQLAVGAAGMLFGGYATLWILERNGVDLGNWEWVVLLAGGVLAAALALAVLETALVVLSSILGAGLLVGAARLEGLPAAISFAVLVIVGVSVQMGSQGRKPGQTKKVRARAR
jgi:hypothetical protein